MFDDGNKLPLEIKIKALEHNVEKSLLNRDNVIVARLDGLGFSKFTKLPNTPFDSDFASCMQNTAQLVKLKEASSTCFSLGHYRYPMNL